MEISKAISGIDASDGCIEPDQKQSIGLLPSVNEGCRHPLKRIAAALLSKTVLGLLTSSAAAENSFFRSPHTDVVIYNPASTENHRNRTTISVRVPDNAGNSLQQVVLTQINA